MIEGKCRPALFVVMSLTLSVRERFLCSGYRGVNSEARTTISPFMVSNLTADISEVLMYGVVDVPREHDQRGDILLGSSPSCTHLELASTQL